MCERAKCLHRLESELQMLLKAQNDIYAYFSITVAIAMHSILSVPEYRSVRRGVAPCLLAWLGSAPIATENDPKPMSLRTTKNILQ